MGKQHIETQRKTRKKAEKRKIWKIRKKAKSLKIKKKYSNVGEIFLKQALKCAIFFNIQKRTMPKPFYFSQQLRQGLIWLIWAF